MTSAWRTFRAARVAILLLAAGAGWAIARGPAWAQGNFGRTAATGDWGDALWVYSSGVVGALPASGATAVIGQAAFPHASALGTAAVDLSGTWSAASVRVGSQSGGLGALSIQPDGSLTTGSLVIGASGGAGSLSLATGAALTVTGTLSAGIAGGSAMINLNGQTISAGGYLQNGPVTINRGVGGGIQGGSFNVSGSSFVIQEGDSFTTSGSVFGGATVSNAVTLSLSNGLAAQNSGTSYTAGAPLTLGGGVFAGDVFDNAVFNANANVTVTAPLFRARNGGVLNLNAGTFVAPTLGIENGGSINRTGGTYDLGRLSLVGGSLSHEASDKIANELSLSSGASFTLQKNLALTGALSVSNSTLNLNGRQASVNSLSLSGAAATITRGMGGGIQASSFSINGVITYAIDGSDSFTNLGISGGATVSNAVALNLAGGLAVQNSGTSYTAGAPLTLGGVLFSNDVFDNAVFNANANVTVSAPLFRARNGGVLNLNAGTFVAPTLGIENGGAINAQNNVALSTNLSISAGSSLNVFQSPGDGNGLTLQGNLDVNSAATINLTFDVGEGPGPIDFAFRWAGNHVAALTPLFGSQITATGAPKPVSVIYEPAKYDDFTYVGFVPVLGDLNGDGDINVLDYLSLSTNLLADVSALDAFESYVLGDLNGDRKINGADFVAFRTSYDDANGVGAFAAMLASIPEPSTAWLAAMACAPWALRSAKR